MEGNMLQKAPYEPKEEPIVEEVKKLAIGSEEALKFTEILRKYKEGKVNLENKIVENEQYWKLKQHEGEGGEVKSTAWLWNCINTRHADAMDGYPTCNIQPRQFDDKDEAERLSAILPVIFEQNRYEETYSDVIWYTLKQGGSVQGVFWDRSKHNGLGDIEIKKVDFINFFWESGIDDIQKSTYVFTTELVDNDILNQRYPETEGKLNVNPSEVKKYAYDDKVDTSNKSVVVDVYYHKELNGKKVLHYCKYVNDIVLFATENEPEAYPNGLYDHGLYPFVVMQLYPIEASLCGYGLIDIAKNTSDAIDNINFAISDNALDGASARYFVSEDTGINEDEYKDRRKKFVHVAGTLDERHMVPVVSKELASIYVNFLQMKQEEMKFITANQDVANGANPSGVTAGSAISALQESAGKASRDANKNFYRAYRDVVYQVIELIRQFYDLPRCFRIAPDASKAESFTMYSNAGIKPQPQMIGGNDMGLRLPEFDVDISAEKKNPYKKMEMNELALNFYNIGFFNPQMADQALACLEIMDFDQKDAIIDKIQQNQTLEKRLIEMEQVALSLAQQVNPSLADRLGQMIMSDMQTALPSGSPNIDLDSTDNSLNGKASKTARESTQV